MGKYKIGDKVSAWNYRKTKRYYDGVISKINPGSMTYRYSIRVIKTYVGIKVKKTSAKKAVKKVAKKTAKKKTVKKKTTKKKSAKKKR